MAIHPPRNSLIHKCSISTKWGAKRKIFLMYMGMAFLLIKHISALPSRCMNHVKLILSDWNFPVTILENTSIALSKLLGNSNRRSSSQEPISYLIYHTHPHTPLFWVHCEAPKSGIRVSDKSCNKRTRITVFPSAIPHLPWPQDSSTKWSPLTIHSIHVLDRDFRAMLSEQPSLPISPLTRTSNPETRFWGKNRDPPTILF